MGHFIFNERVLLALIAFGAWLIQKIAAARKKAAAQREGRPVATGPHGDVVSASGQPAEEEEARTRRVKEEVARKIAQRKFAERKILMMPAARPQPKTPPRPAAPMQTPTAPLYSDLPPETFLEAEAAPPALAVPALPSYAEALQSLRRSPISMPALVEAAYPERSGATWLEELRQPQMARRAILLQEILGPPVSLR